MGDKLRFNDNDHGGLYEPTDSEENYSEEEKDLLQKVRQGNRRKQNSKQEVFAFDESDDNDDDDEGEEEDDDIGDLMADSDIEGAEKDDDDLPDRKAWGSKSRNFYGADFVDPNYGSYNDKELELALAEEEEALAIQKRLANDIKDEHFFELFPNNSSTKGSDNEKDEIFNFSNENNAKITKIKTSLGSLPNEEKLQIFNNDAPEFIGLVADLQMGLNECGNLLLPVLKYAKAHKVPNIPALQFAEVMNTFLTTYCSNINFYLILKANRVPIQTHPITSRLLELKEIHESLSERYENIIKPQLEALMERIEDGDEFVVLEPRKTTEKEKWSKRMKSASISKGVKAPDDASNLEQSSEEHNAEEIENSMAELPEEDGGDERRGITYQISKNKGLTPHRKKELRNPRVKHRSKFRKALIRRKGAVRTVRTETKRYGGEVSGIKATVSKSVKFKT